MVTLMSHISDYFEQFNSSLAADYPPIGLESSQPSPWSYYVFDFERYSDQIPTLHELRRFMIDHWHRSFFYALAYLCLIYGKTEKDKSAPSMATSVFSPFRWSDVYEK